MGGGGAGGGLDLRLLMKLRVLALCRYRHVAMHGRMTGPKNEGRREGPRGRERALYVVVLYVVCLYAYLCICM